MTAVIVTCILINLDYGMTYCARGKKKLRTQRMHTVKNSQTMPDIPIGSLQCSVQWKSMQTSVRTCIYTSSSVHIRTYVCACVCMCVWVCVHACVSVCARVWVCVHACEPIETLKETTKHPLAAAGGVGGGGEERSRSVWGLDSGLHPCFQWSRRNINFIITLHLTSNRERGIHPHTHYGAHTHTHTHTHTHACIT